MVISNVRSVPSAARRLAPIVPKRSPCSQIAWAQPVEAGPHLARAGVGGQVEVEVVGRLTEQQVAHGAADEIELVTSVGEALRQRRQLGEHGGEAFGDHRGRHNARG